MTGSKSAALDTNVAIEVLNDVSLAVNWLKTVQVVYLPVIVLGELLYGARNGKLSAENLRRIVQFRQRCDLVVVDGAVAETYSAVRIHLKKVGSPIPENDMWIAAACLANGLPLATYDSHFLAIPGLTVEQP